MGESGMNDQYKKASEVVNALFSGFNSQGMNTANSIIRGWKETVGDKIASHSKIIDVNKGNLIVEVDHAGWSQQILLRKKQIITVLSTNFPDLNIRNIILRVVSECETPYVQTDEIVGSGVLRVTENEQDVEINQSMDDELKQVLERLKASIKKGKPME